MSQSSRVASGGTGATPRPRLRPRRRGRAAAARAAGQRVAVAASLSLLAAGALAQDRFVDDIRVSRTGSEAEIAIQLACPMRYQADVPTAAGALIEVRVAPFEQCRSLGPAGGIYGETYRPNGGGIAHLVELEFESLGIGDSLLMLRFDRPVDYRVTQRADLRTLVVTVALDSTPALTELPPATPPPAASAPGAPRGAVPPSDRSPLTSRVVTVATTPDYMINLSSEREAPEPALVRAVPTPPGARIYVSQTELDGVTWHRLRLGFFASEAEARAALAPLATEFPRAWIGRAEPEEIRLANEFDAAKGLAVIAPRPAAQPAPAAAGAPAPEEIPGLLEEARNAMLDEQFGRAVSIYTRLLAAPGGHRATAYEFLGLAYERLDATADARAQYQAYLREFPDADGSARVRQRLAGLDLDTLPAPPLREASGDARWSFSTGVAQYYRRDLNRFDEEQDEIVTFSALLTDLDLSLARRGDKLDLTTRLSLTHTEDMLDERFSDRRPTRVSYGYAEIAAHDTDWSLRLGRQSLHSFGVLGRFDGAHFAYGIAPTRTVHFATGYPVESTRDSLETDRNFVGAAIELEDLGERWDLSFFVNQQTIEGVAARNAVGTEVRYLDDRRSLTSLIDYDVDFGVSNTLLLLGTWRFADRVTLSALFDERKSPVLTTRNALIGQPVASIEEMLLVWTEDEIRQLAVDRTADSQTVTLGVAAPLAERFQLNFDVTLSEIGGTPASGGVTEIPGTGTQMLYSASLVGTSLLKTGDVGILSLRTGESDTYSTNFLSWDLRLPIGRRIRINPRLRFATWESPRDGRKRETLSPALRLLVNMRNRYRIELELGASRQRRTDPSGTSESSGSFVNIGYRANF